MLMLLSAYKLYIFGGRYFVVVHRSRWIETGQYMMDMGPDPPLRYRDALIENPYRQNVLQEFHP